MSPSRSADRRASRRNPSVPGPLPRRDGGGTARRDNFPTLRNRNVGTNRDQDTQNEYSLGR